MPDYNDIQDRLRNAAISKGPWTQRAPEINGQINRNYRVIEAYKSYFNGGGGFGIYGLISPADAALMAAAPDLLAALSMALVYLYDLEMDNFTDEGAGVFHDKELRDTYEAVLAAMDKALPIED